MTLRLPPAMDEQTFLSDYWQKQPLLIRGGMRDLLPAITPAELAGLACNQDIEARLLRSAGAPSQWQMQHGPFGDEDFAALPESHWTLLVQDVDKWLPEVATLLQHFNFIPSWRVDDVMISYASPGGTVGPHIDEYDVFLIQGDGSRVWETGRSANSTIPDLPVRVLADFVVEDRWELATGDVLYLPPGLAHYGIADVPGMTISVGFRAPSVAELILSQAAYQAEHATGRYQDPDLSLPEANSGLIAPAAIKRALALIQAQVGTTNDATAWFGQLVTENKPWLQPAGPEEPDSLAQFSRRLAQGDGLRKHPAVRMAHSTEPDFGLLFVDGESCPLTSNNCILAPGLCRDDTLLLSDANDDCRRLLYQLYCDGKLYWIDDD